METLAKAMKDREFVNRRVLSDEQYIIIRLDGKAFHSYTKGLNRPYDVKLMDAMDQTLEYLMKEISGVRLGYVESDEISLLITSWKEVEKSDSNPDGIQKGELWMGGVEAKLLSLTAALATAKFNHVRQQQRNQELLESNNSIIKDTLATFDSRIITFEGTRIGRELVKKYFLWRRKDSIKNSITMAALANFSHSELHKKNSDDKIAMLKEIKQPWDELPEGFKTGRYSIREKRQESVTFTHKKTQEEISTIVERNHILVKPFKDFMGIFTSDTLPKAIKKSSDIE